jgi:hypothetical protein
LVTTAGIVVKKTFNVEASGSSSPLIFEKAQGTHEEISGAEVRNYTSGEVLVKFKPYVTEAEIERIAAISGLEMMKMVSPPNLFLFKVIGNSSSRDVIKSLERFEEIEYSGPNYLRKNSG